MMRLHPALGALLAAALVVACGDADRTDTPPTPSATMASGGALPGNAVDLTQGRPSFHFQATPGPGGRIAFARVVDGLGNIFVADSNGANARRISSGIWDYAPRLSPDGRWVAFGSETNSFDVLLVSADSGETRPLAATGAREDLIDWLPDGSGVLYTKNTGLRVELWIATIDGKQSALVARDGNVNGTVSPDGKWLAYDVAAKGKRTLWLYDFATAKNRQLTTEGYEAIVQAHGIWSPDSRRIVYQSTRSGTADIWSIDVNTGATRQLTTDVRDDLWPKYSPDGSRVAFVSNRGGQVDLWVVPDSGGDAVRITDDRAQEAGFEWALDGRSLLVEANGGASYAYVASLDGSAPRRLLDGDTQQLYASLSRDGTRVALTLFDGSQTDVAVAAIGGGAVTVVADGPSEEMFPAMSPDGQQVAYASNRSGNPDIYVAPASGGPAKRLADWSSEEVQPLWSPDGQWIAFRSSHESPSDVWVVKADGTGVRRLTRFGSVNDYAWSHDGRDLVVWAATSGGDAVYTVSVAEGTTRTVADGAYGMASFAPGDSLVLVTGLAGGFARQELRRRDGAVAQMLSPKGERVYEVMGRVSPDGTMRAFSQFTFKDNDYLPTVQPIAGGAARRLFERSGNTLSLSWLPDGKSVLFVFRDRKPSLYRLPIP
jgi:Tol biopolymer transport system component